MVHKMGSRPNECRPSGTKPIAIPVGGSPPSQKKKKKKKFLLDTFEIQISPLFNAEINSIKDL